MVNLRWLLIATIFIIILNALSLTVYRIHKSRKWLIGALVANVIALGMSVFGWLVSSGIL